MNRSMQSKMLKAKKEASKYIKENSYEEITGNRAYSTIPSVFLQKPYSVHGVGVSIRNYKPATVAV